MFGRAKRRAKAVAKPETGEESFAVNQGLRAKYPDMMSKTGAWSKPRKGRKQTVVAKIKQARKDQDDSLRGALSPEEYKRLVGD